MEVVSYLNGRLLQKNEIIEVKNGELYETYKRIISDLKKRFSTTEKPLSNNS